MELEHIGIAVSQLNDAVALFETLLGTSCYRTETVPGEQVITAFLSGGRTKIELLQGISPDSMVSRFIARRGEGLHHIAFEVPDLESAMRRLAAAGFELLSGYPRKGADNKLVCFLHPRSAHGVLIELCQEIRN
ncbi:MAG TPA: methylmalonyl-CoA epimerase [Chitinophagaceae bacterium]|nr:methylmalonyl-CoA epimerase [Chitinophagaceae bacterium]